VEDAITAMLKRTVRQPVAGLFLRFILYTKSYTKICELAVPKKNECRKSCLEIQKQNSILVKDVELESKEK